MEVATLNARLGLGCIFGCKLQYRGCEPESKQSRSSGDNRNARPPVLSRPLCEGAGWCVWRRQLPSCRNGPGTVSGSVYFSADERPGPRPAGSLLRHQVRWTRPQPTLAHPVLGPRLVECTRLVNEVEDRTIQEIFGVPEDLKFRSSMTAGFAHAAGRYRLLELRWRSTLRASPTC